jgi:hypothetical protein
LSWAGWRDAIGAQRQPEQVRRRSDQHTGTGDGQRGRPAEPFQKHLGLIHAAVAIQIGKHTQSPQLLSRLFAVIDHFDDPQPAGGVKLKCDRINDQRFGGNQFDRQAIQRLEGIDRLFGAERLESWQADLCRIDTRR